MMQRRGLDLDRGGRSTPEALGVLQDIGSKYGVNGTRIYSVSPIHPSAIRAATCTARNAVGFGLAQLLLPEARGAEIDCRRQWARGIGTACVCKTLAT